MLRMNLDRPAFASDTYARPGDNSTTPVTASFTMPDFLVQEGKECRVRSVRVDFYKYNTGAASNNNIDLTVTSLLRENLPGNNTVTKTGLFNEAVGSATTDGVRSTVVYRGTPGSFGGGFRISLGNIRGVAIERIVVEIEEQETPVV